MAEEYRDCSGIVELDDQLDCLRDNLLNAQRTLKTADSNISASEKQIVAIEALITKRDQVIKDYEIAYPSLDTKQKDFEAFYNDEKKCLENLLTLNGITNVTNIQREVRDNVNNLQSKIDCEKNGLDGDATTGKRHTLDSYKKELEDAKRDYDLWTDPVKSIESRFKLLENSKKEIDKEHSAGNYAYAYYLLVDFPRPQCPDKKELKELVKHNSFQSHLNGVPKVELPKDINNKLMCAWKEYQQADKKLNDITGKVKGAEKVIETNQKQLVEDVKNLEATIKRQLNSLKDDPGSGGGGCEQGSESKLAVTSAGSVSKIEAESYQGVEKKTGIVDSNNK